MGVEVERPSDARDLMEIGKSDVARRRSLGSTGETAPDETGMGQG